MDLGQIYSPVAVELQAVDRKIKSQRETLCGDSVLVDTIFQSFFKTSGKKLRPSLVILSAFALRQDNMRSSKDSAVYDNLISLATITELVHCASLMHDDVLDAALTRRDQPSLNAQFGDKIAILGGDMLYSQAFEILAAVADRDIIRMLARCVRGMCRGEVSNLSDHDFNGYLGVIEDKTASFMEFCCRAGALLAGSGEEDRGKVESLAKFGYHFGMVYQLVDDLGDCDDVVAMTSMEDVLLNLDRHILDAGKHLAEVPDSIYKASLSKLLHFVASKRECPADTGCFEKTGVGHREAVVGSMR